MKNNFLKGMLAFLVLFLLAGNAFAEQNSYAVLNLKGGVNPIVADYIVEGIDSAVKDGAQFIVIKMDTPGGLMDAMREIIQAILTAEVPVVVFTAPKGAQAASAGGFIMLSAHIAAMAPGTEIGAMHPVSPALDFMKKDEKGGPEGVMEKKVLNDTLAYGRSLAQKRKRNVNWTERAIKDAISSTYTEAKKLGVIDLVAEDMDDLLKKLHNRKVDLNGKMVTLKTQNLKELTYEMDWKQKFLNRFADPQIVFLLFIIAVAGIGMEFKNPGMIVPGVIGGISLFMFLMAIQIIPINAVGLLLIILAVVLFILELQIVSYGLLTLGGIIAFVAGSMLLFDSPLPGGHIPMSSIIAAVLFIMFIVFVVVRLVFKAHRERVSTGREGLVGEECRALNNFVEGGKVMVHGEIWNAIAPGEVFKDEILIVKEVKGMTLILEKKQ
jgi:membrane-bound serine protease (ClpP class)